MSDERKVWVVLQDVTVHDLEAALNELAASGYQVHSVHLACRYDYEPKRYNVLAFEPTLIMKKQGEDMMAQMSALMAKPGVP